MICGIIKHNQTERKETKKMKIFFDMDGTIANLYGVENWLDFLRAEEIIPYKEAMPMVNMSQLARLLNRLQAEGYEIGIISWTSKNGTAEYNEAVKKTKLRWLQKHLPSVLWDEIYIVEYGTPKNNLGSGILFDDEENNRKCWSAADSENYAFSEKEIIKILQEII